MTNLWAFLLQTLYVTGVGLLLLAIKTLLKDKLSPPLAVCGLGGVGPSDLASGLYGKVLCASPSALVGGDGEGDG